MIPEELGKMEQALGVTLPRAYRDAMTAYPFPEDSPAAELWVLNHVGQLWIQLPQGRRRPTDGDTA
jgi:hypothetical protein